jgi:hypothetical protein
MQRGRVRRRRCRGGRVEVLSPRRHNGAARAACHFSHRDAESRADVSARGAAGIFQLPAYQHPRADCGHPVGRRARRSPGVSFSFAGAGGGGWPKGRFIRPTSRDGDGRHLERRGSHRYQMVLSAIAKTKMKIKVRRPTAKQVPGPSASRKLTFRLRPLQVACPAAIHTAAIRSTV